MRRKEWFGEWFDSPYYHVLYKHRDNEEAKYFLDNLIGLLKPPPCTEMLDLACGKGRHSIYLSQKGYNVTGLDLSAQNIAAAKKFENGSLHFDTHDMREVYAKETFDYIFNLFTSFGYFDTMKEHEDTILSISTMLRPGGRFVLDFLNPYRVTHHLVHEEIKRIDGIEFHINRDVEGDFIVKNIELFDNGNRFEFHEKVRTICRAEFLEFFEKAGLRVEFVFGNYELDDYDPERSDRLIFVTQKL